MKRSSQKCCEGQRAVAPRGENLPPEQQSKLESISPSSNNPPLLMDPSKLEFLPSEFAFGFLSNYQKNSYFGNNQFNAHKEIPTKINKFFL